MAKDFWEPWEWRLWLGDPDLGMCHPSTRGIWMDALCAMMERKTHSLTGTPDQLARVCRCSVSDILTSCQELEEKGAANVVRQNDSITLTCRKRHRELEVSGLRSKAGRAGADSRWQRNSKTNGKHDGKHDGNPLTMTIPISVPESGGEFEGVPTESEFVAHCASPTCGILPAEATDLYLKLKQRGWKDGGGAVVENWKAYVSRMKKYIEQDRAQKPAVDPEPKRNFVGKRFEKAVAK